MPSLDPSCASASPSFGRVLLALLLAATAPPGEVGGPSAAEGLDHSRPLVYLDAGGAPRPVRDAAGWERRRRAVIEGFERAAGELPDLASLGPLEVREIARADEGDHVRLTITYRAEPGDRVPAHLYLPRGEPGRRRPAILALHPTSPIGKDVVLGLGPRPNRQYALELARRGYVVLAPDYPSFGEYAGYDFAADDYPSGTLKGIVNHLRGVDLLASRPEVDPERIGVIGHSLGGHNAIFAALFDPRLKVVVSSCGWTPFHDYHGGDLRGWASERYLPRLESEFGLDPDRAPFDFYELVAALAPRPFFTSSPVGDGNFDHRGVRKAIAAARGVYRLYGAEERLQARYPDAGHDFPTPVRREAYRFIDAALGHRPPAALAAAGEGAAPAAPETPWRAGVAAAVITPTEPRWLAGFAARNHPSEGKVQDLWAKALAIEDRAGGRIAIVTLDLIAVPRPLRDALERGVRERYGLAPRELLLAASHTHTGPELRDDKAVLLGLPPAERERCRRYAARLADRLLDLVGEALGSLEGARLGWTHARCGFAMNRRLITARGVFNRPNPDGPVDHEVPVLRVDSPAGDLRAVLFGYACHNTTLSSYRFSGDYAGFAQAALEEAHPGARALFLAGCGADQNPQPRGTLAVAEQHGRSLALAVEAALLARARPLEGPLRAAYGHARLEFAKVPGRGEIAAMASSRDVRVQRRGALLKAELERRGALPARYPCPVQVVRFGEGLDLVALGGEVVVDYALRLRREHRGAPLWVAAYAGDVFGYVPSRRLLAEGGYEAGGAMLFTALPGPFAPSVEETLIGKVRELLERARARGVGGE